jgi:hypothetical protein
MDLNSEPTGQEPAPDATPVVVNNEDKMMGVREAARQLSRWRQEKKQASAPQEPQQAEQADEPVQVDLAPEANTEPAEAPPIGETEGESEPQEAALIEPPLSWSAEEKDRFAQLPPEIQQTISNREKERDSEVRRRQNEVAERLRALEPEQQAMQRARAQYEQALPILLQTIQSNPEFADIKSYEDVERLARDDWPRYVQWDAHQKKAGAIQQELVAAQQRQHAEFAQHWENYAREQDRMFSEKVPEFSDPNKAKPLQELAVKALQEDYGFSHEEMLNAWNGPFRDHRVQQMLLDAARYRQLKKNPPKPTAKPVPPVQRPGTASSANAGTEAEIKALEQKLQKSGSIKDAAALMAARRRLTG